MITDADIKKLKKVFVTKDDLLAFEKRQNERFATREMFEVMKNNMSRMHHELLLLIKDLREDIEDGFASLRQEIFNEKIRREQQFHDHIQIHV